MRDKNILVVESHQAAELIRRQIAHPYREGDPVSLRDGNPDFFVTYPGAPIMGRRTSMLLVADGLYQRLTHPYEEDAQEQQDHRWWRECALTRLSPSGVIVRL